MSNLGQTLLIPARGSASGGGGAVDTIFIVDSTGRYVLDTSGNYLVTVAGAQSVPDSVGDSAFVPTDVSGMALWLDASTLSLANNDPVSSWTDMSGNAKHAVQATGAKQPLFKTAILTGYEGQVATPRPVVRFDGSDDFLATSALDLTSGKAATVFVVCGNITGGSQVTIVETSANYAANSGAFRVTREAANTVKSWVWTTGGGATGAAAVTALTVSTNYVGLSTFFDTAELNSNGFRPGKTATYLNNGERDGSLANDSGVTANLGNHALYIGARAGTSLFMAGDIAEVILYRGHLSHRDRGLIDLYLRDKYDLYS